jgi:hypothetical protein
MTTAPLKGEGHMFDKYLICPYGLRNVLSDTGHLEGFEVKIRIPYYRGVPLSVIDSITLTVGGETYTNEHIRFSVASGSFMMSEMSTVATKRWNLDEDATLRIYKPGGLVYFDQQVELLIAIRAPYGLFTGHDAKRMTMEPDLRYALVNP